MIRQYMKKGCSHYLKAKSANIHTFGYFAKKIVGSTDGLLVTLTKR